MERERENKRWGKRESERGRETQGKGRKREDKNFYLNLLWGSEREKKETPTREMEKERVSLER